VTAPPTLIYPCASIHNFIYQFTNTLTPAQTSFQLTSNTILFQTIPPHRILIGVSKNIANKTRNDADAFAPITNINITWNNTSGILSTLNQFEFDLYQVCVKNGLKKSWADFSGQTISVYNYPQSLRYSEVHLHQLP
jgi:hypothetical protein